MDICVRAGHEAAAAVAVLVLWAAASSEGQTVLIVLSALTHGHCSHSSLPDKGHFVSHLRFVYMLIHKRRG